MSKIIAFKRDRRNFNAGSEGRIPHEENTAKVRYQRDGAAPSSADSDRRGITPVTGGIEVSIVVPTCSRPPLLDRCIASLVLQHFDPDRFEIIVVDDAADVDAPGGDTTREVVARWAAHTAGNGPEVIYIPSMGPRGPAAARNHGWRAARGPIIAFTNDDTIARNDWLKNGVYAFAENVHAVWGRIVMPLPATPPTDYQIDAKKLENVEFVTANCFCRKHVLDDLGGFDERFRYAWREDSDLHFRLLDYHARIVHEPKAVMMHPIRPAGWGVSLSQVKKVQFDALLFKKHPALYRKKIQAKPRWDFYITVGALLACIAALLANATGTAVMAGMVWLFMTTRFCRQRLEQTSRSPAHIAEMAVTSALIPPLAVFWRAVGAFKFRVGFL